MRDGGGKQLEEKARGPRKGKWLVTLESRSISPLPSKVMVAPCALSHSAHSSAPPASLPSASSEEKPRTWATNATGTVGR